MERRNIESVKLGLLLVSIDCILNFVSFSFICHVLEVRAAVDPCNFMYHSRL